MVPYIISSDSITIFLDGVQTFPSTHILFKDIKNAVKSGDEKKLKSVLTKKINKNNLEIRENEVLYNGQPLNTVAVKRLFEMKKEGFDTKPLINFLKNCYKNPFPQVVEKLYEFLSTRDMPLTEDGCFIGYKYTNADYWDNYTGKTYQFIPNTHVKANKIDLSFCDMSGEECSENGIHVGNFQYSGGYNTVVYVKINPKDVLSVPVGSGAKKIRVWELDVLDRVDGKKDVSVVNNKGKDLKYKVGDSLDCQYKDGDGKIIDYVGQIKNVGEKYLELEPGWDSNRKDKNKANKLKVRLKISNIQE
jgi:hypothetical protein